jgi:hypothetical protein
MDVFDGTLFDGTRCRRHPPITAVVPPGQKIGVFDGDLATYD